MVQDCQRLIILHTIFEKEEGARELHTVLHS